MLASPLGPDLPAGPQAASLMQSQPCAVSLNNTPCGVQCMQDPLGSFTSGTLQDRPECFLGLFSWLVPAVSLGSLKETEDSWGYTAQWGIWPEDSKCTLKFSEGNKKEPYRCRVQEADGLIRDVCGYGELDCCRVGTKSHCTAFSSLSHSSLVSGFALRTLGKSFWSVLTTSPKEEYHQISSWPTPESSLPSRCYH